MSTTNVHKHKNWSDLQLADIARLPVAGHKLWKPGVPPGLHRGYKEARAWMRFDETGRNDLSARFSIRSITNVIR